MEVYSPSEYVSNHPGSFLLGAAIGGLPEVLLYYMTLGVEEDMSLVVDLVASCPAREKLKDLRRC